MLKISFTPATQMPSVQMDNTKGPRMICTECQSDLRAIIHLVGCKAASSLSEYQSYCPFCDQTVKVDEKNVKFDEF